MSDAVTVRPKDWVPFRCRLCGSCCRNLRGNLMPEQLDAHRLARFLRERGELEFMEDFYTKYTYPDMLEGFFPIFMMNTAGPDDSCVFLENGRCSVYEARPRVCRLYPFTAFPGQRGKAFNFFRCMDNHSTHFSDGKILVKDWMYQNFSREDREFLTAESGNLLELGRLFKAMLSTQKALLGEPDSPPRAYNHYLIPDGDDGPKITIQRLRVQIDTLHRRFIQRLAGYFRSVYNITVEEKKIISELLLPKPPKSKKQALKEYLLWASSIQLHYEDIVTQILSCFDGRTPSEQSLQELCRRCNEAVWCSSRHTAKFERKYAVISFLGTFCSFRNDRQHWTFTSNMGPVLLCAAHFETGVLNKYPVFFPSPPFDGTYGCNQMDFAGCEKLAQLRLFKNGRVDLRFTSEDYANQFIDTYLGGGYQESDGEAAV